MPSKLLDHTSLTLVHLYGEAQGLDRAVEAVTVPGRKKAEAGRANLELESSKAGNSRTEPDHPMPLPSIPLYLVIHIR